MRWLISPPSPLLTPLTIPFLGNPRSFGIVKNLVTLSDQLPRLMLQLLRGLFLVRLSQSKNGYPYPRPSNAPHHTSVPLRLRLRLRLQPMPIFNMACALPIFFLAFIVVVASAACGGGSGSKYLFYVQPCGRFFPWALIILSCLPIVRWLRFLCRL